MKIVMKEEIKKDKDFWQVSVEYENGSYFLKDLIVEKHHYYVKACYVFYDFEKCVYHAFEKHYDSAEIFVNTVHCVNNVWITTIKAKNELTNKSDVCQIKKELKTYRD